MPSGRNFSRVPGCWPANSQRSRANRPASVTASTAGWLATGRISRAGAGCSPTGAASSRCSRPSSCGPTTFTWPSAWISRRPSLGTHLGPVAAAVHCWAVGQQCAGPPCVSPLHRPRTPRGGEAFFEGLELGHHGVEQGRPLLQQVPQPSRRHSWRTTS